MNPTPACLTLLSILALASCAPNGLPPAEGLHGSAVTQIKQAGGQSLTVEQRAVLYLNSAREASRLLVSSESSEEARIIYNKATADLVLLLRAAKHGAMWSQPLTLTHEGATYRLRYAGKSRDGNWDSNHFTSFTPAAEVDLKTIKRRNRIDGIGGALVSLRVFRESETRRSGGARHLLRRQPEGGARRFHLHPAPRQRDGGGNFG
jgi:hypothetical protein